MLKTDDTQSRDARAGSRGLDSPRIAAALLFSKRVATAFTSRFSPRTRTVLALIVICYMFADRAVVPVYLRRAPVDELTWAQRSLLPWTFPYERVFDKSRWTKEYRLEYYYCIHHPSAARILYGTVLRSAGFSDPPADTYDYNVAHSENEARGNFLPQQMREPMRLTNAVLVLGATIILFFGMLQIQPSRALAAAAALMVVYEPTVSWSFNSVIGYIGSDALLMLALVAFWLALLGLRDRGIWGAAIIGVIGGLATSTKINGAMTLVGALLYFALRERGRLRLLKPAVMGAVSVAVFLAMNPVYFGGGLAWMWRVFHDTLALLYTLQTQAMAQKHDSWLVTQRWELLQALFPYLLFALPSAALLWRSRRAWWFAPTAAWAGALIFGNLFGLVLFLPTYAAPVRVAFLVILLAAALEEAKRIGLAGGAPGISLAPARERSLA